MIECENTPHFPTSHIQINADAPEIFQRSGLSKFAAATVRLAEQQGKSDLILSSSSGKMKNDNSFMNHAQPRPFMEHTDPSDGSPNDEAIMKRAQGKPEPQDERHHFT